MSTTMEALRADAGVEQRLLATLQYRIGIQKYNAWFKHGTRLSVEEEHVRLTVPNPFVANWIETHYYPELAAAVETHVSGKRRITITIDPTLSDDLRKHQLDRQAEIVAKTAAGRTRPKYEPQPVRLKHKLEDFVVGDCNKLAYSAALAMAGSEKPPFNPLFIHGHCGLGKTHLLQGVCDSLSHLRGASRSPAWKYVTAEEFTNEFITAIRGKKLDAFRARYRRLELLAIDDVHFLSAKKATQDEFLHTFDALESAGNKIVMASDAHPRLVGELNAQLVSRFVAGMVVNIQPPEKPIRMKMLHQRARSMKLTVPEEVLEYIAVNIRGSFRELEGALVKLAALAALETAGINLAVASEALADHLAKTDSALTLGDIEAAAATQFGITQADINSSRRTQTVSAARMVSVFLARRHTRMSYPEIGRFMGKNHSSIVLAEQRMERLLAEGGDVHWMSPAGQRSMRAAKLIELLTELIV